MTRDEIVKKLLEIALGNTTLAGRYFERFVKKNSFSYTLFGRVCQRLKEGKTENSISRRLQDLQNSFGIGKEVSTASAQLFEFGKISSKGRNKLRMQLSKRGNLLSSLEI